MKPSQGRLPDADTAAIEKPAADEAASRQARVDALVQQAKSEHADTLAELAR